MSSGYVIARDGSILMRCPEDGCEADGNGAFWAEMGEEEYVDDHCSLLTFPEDAPCPACGTQGIEVEA